MQTDSSAYLFDYMNSSRCNKVYKKLIQYGCRYLDEVNNFKYTHDNGFHHDLQWRPFISIMDAIKHKNAIIIESPYDVLMATTLIPVEKSLDATCKYTIKTLKKILKCDYSCKPKEYILHSIEYKLASVEIVFWLSQIKKNNYQKQLLHNCYELVAPYNWSPIYINIIANANFDDFMNTMPQTYGDYIMLLHVIKRILNC